MRPPATAQRIGVVDVMRIVVPVAALALYAAITFLGGQAIKDQPPLWLSLVVFPILFATVIAAVVSAEEIAHEIGEPFGTLVLTISVTVIEVALIMAIMLEDKGNPTLARDTVFAVVMIVANGLVGICMLAGGLRYYQQDFESKGANVYLAVLTALSMLTMVLPNFTVSSAGPVLTSSQLIFVSIITLLLYALFLYIQTVRHTEFFKVEIEDDDTGKKGHGLRIRAPVLLVASLLAVVLLSKTFTASLQGILTQLGAPEPFLGFLVALLILSPEGITAVRAARMNELQRSINLALGSSLATIGMTVPAVAVITIFTGKDLILGLGAESMVLLFLTLLVSVYTFGTGRTNILFGFLHLIIFATYIFLIFVP
ncbi:calcium:proton antiporter [Rhodomicrobium lacus]|uniref:calcium:proton antiporter n=1 Tax=Rhodomicrobium lacus TaxID=2498452 RepID=UPI0026E1EF47|nr:ionic transporter y4hA [Rhodomicrobium lacus]WKW52305.1 ionic transporter y4hA [Rhodomicrobium lacus]